MEGRPSRIVGWLVLAASLSVALALTASASTSSRPPAAPVTADWPNPLAPIQEPVADWPNPLIPMET